MFLSKTLGLLAAVAVANASTCRPYSQSDFQKNTWSIRAYEKEHCEDVIGTIDETMKTKKDMDLPPHLRTKRTPNKCYPITWGKQIGSVHGYDQADYTVAIFKDSNCQKRQRIKRYRPEKDDHPHYWEPKEQGQVKSYMFTYLGSPPYDGTWPRTATCLPKGEWFSTKAEKKHNGRACKAALKAAGKHTKMKPLDSEDELWGPDDYQFESCVLRTLSMQAEFDRVCTNKGHEHFQCRRYVLNPSNEGAHAIDRPCNSTIPNRANFKQPKYPAIMPINADWKSEPTELNIIPDD